MLHDSTEAEATIPMAEIIYTGIKIAFVMAAGLGASARWVLLADLTGVVKDYLAAAATIALTVIAIAGAVDRFRRERRVSNIKAQAEEASASAELAKASVQKVQAEHELRINEIRAEMAEKELRESKSRDAITAQLTATLESLARAEENQKHMREGLHSLRDKLQGETWDKAAMLLFLEQLSADAASLKKVAEKIEQKSADGAR